MVNDTKGGSLLSASLRRRLLASLLALDQRHALVLSQAIVDLGDDAGAESDCSVTQREPLALFHHHGLQELEVQPETPLI